NPPASTLFLGNLSFDCSEETLTEVFHEYGQIKGIRLPTDRETGAPKGFGYLEMTSTEEAVAAFDALQGADVAGRPVRLDYAKAREDAGGDRGGRGGGRGFGDRGDRGGRGGRGGTTNRGGFGDFSGKKVNFD
ncbi:nuclear localization sequence binding protein, partial [Oleoguttula sp. CCFEE 5521]